VTGASDQCVIQTFVFKIGTVLAMSQ